MVILQKITDVKIDLNEKHAVFETMNYDFDISFKGNL